MRDKRGKIQELLTKDGRGAGGFLDPPGYPTHEYVVMTDINRRPENRGMLSVDYAVSQDWVEPSVRAACQRVLDAWQADKPEMDREWALQVLGYFRDCYQSESGSWNAGDLRILGPDDERPSVDLHAGVHHVRRFYPDWTPTSDDWREAYWGTKPIPA